jgi:hypothetical protein
MVLEATLGIFFSKFPKRIFFIFLFLKFSDTHTNLTENVCDVCEYDPIYFDISALSYAEMLTDEKAGMKPFESIGRRIIIPFNSKRHFYHKIHTLLFFYTKLLNHLSKISILNF